MVTIIWPLLVAVAGALIYALSANPRLGEIGRIMFAAGALWVVYLLAGSTFTLAGR